MMFSHFAVLWDRAIFKVEYPEESAKWYQQNSVQRGVTDCAFAFVIGGLNLALIALRNDTVMGFNQNLGGDRYAPCSKFLSGLIDNKLHLLTNSLAIKPISEAEEQRILEILAAESIKNNGNSTPTTFLLQELIVSTEKIVQTYIKMRKENVLSQNKEIH